jgi:hypothetical protein
MLSDDEYSNRNSGPVLMNKVYHGQMRGGENKLSAPCDQFAIREETRHSHMAGSGAEKSVASSHSDAMIDLRMPKYSQMK